MVDSTPPLYTFARCILAVVLAYSFFIPTTPTIFPARRDLTHCGRAILAASGVMVGFHGLRPWRKIKIGSPKKVNGHNFGDLTLEGAKGISSILDKLPAPAPAIGAILGFIIRSTEVGFPPRYWPSVTQFVPCLIKICMYTDTASE